VKALCSNLGQSTVGASGGRLAQEGREGLDLVARLDLLHVVHVGRVEEVGAADHQGELGLAAEGLGDALGRLCLPVGTGDQVAACAVAGGAAAHGP
jgi:hypothetical protein